MSERCNSQEVVAEIKLQREASATIDLFVEYKRAIGVAVLESHPSFRNCGYVAADIDSLRLVVTGNPYV